MKAKLPPAKLPYHLALENGHDATAKLLVQKGAATNPPQFPLLKGEYLGQKKPGKTPEPFALGIVSSHSINNEHSPAVFSPDGKEVYWNNGYRDSILYMKQVNGAWTAPEKVPFSSEYGDMEPVLSPDGSKLFFNSFRPLHSDKAEERENIWFAERTADGWAEPKPVSDYVNDCDLYWSFSVTNDGTLYFPAGNLKGFGAQDIYYSELVEGEYSAPKNMGKVINSEGFERTPFVAPDKSYIIFASDRHKPLSRDLRLYISYRDKEGNWLPPIDIAKHLGIPLRAICPAVTPDGKYLFLLTRGDIYWMDAGFIEELQPEVKE